MHAHTVGISSHARWAFCVVAVQLWVCLSNMPVISTIAQCPILSKLPVLKKTGDPSHDQDRQQQRDAFVRSVTKMWDHPHLCLACDDWLRAKIEKEQATEGVQSEFCFKEAPATVQDMEYEWICVYLKDKLDMDDRVLGIIKAFDPESVRFLFCQYLNCTPTLKCPEEAIDRRMLHSWCDMRHDQNQGRLKDFLPQAHVAPSGQIDWGQAGSFGLSFEGGKLVRILHRASGIWVQMDEDLGVDQSWNLDHNWCDSKAKLVKTKNRKFGVLGFFIGDSSLPKDSACWTGSCQANFQLWERAAQEVKDRDDAAAVAGQVVELSDAFHTPVKAKQEAATKRARDLLIASNEAKAAKRRVSVSAAGVVAVPASGQGSVPGSDNKEVDGGGETTVPQDSKASKD